MTKSSQSKAFRALDEDFMVDLRDFIREVIQEELDKKKYDGIEHLRKVILANESGGLTNISQSERVLNLQETKQLGKLIEGLPKVEKYD